MKKKEENNEEVSNLEDNNELELEIEFNQEEIIKENLELKEKNESLQKEVLELKDLYLRDKAELENFKRRINDERITERKYAYSPLLTKLLVVIDNFERSLAVKNYESTDDVLKGIEIIKNQLFQSLEQEGLQVLESLDKEFDPNYHQAILTDSIEGKEDNIVLEELQKGYIYKDRVLRPAMVKVNQK